MCEIINLQNAFYLLCILIAAALTYVFSKRLFRYKHKFDAGERLKAILLDFRSWVFEKEDIYNPDDQGWIGIFQKQYAIALEYSSLLSNKALSRFKVVWEQYYHPDGHNPWYMYHRKIFPHIDSKKEPTTKELLTERIDAIIEFVNDEQHPLNFLFHKLKASFSVICLLP